MDDVVTLVDPSTNIVLSLTWDEIIDMDKRKAEGRPIFLRYQEDGTRR